MPQVKYNFVELSTLGDLEKDNTCGSSPVQSPSVRRDG